MLAAAAASQVVVNGGAERSEGKDAVNGVNGAEATHRVAAPNDAPQRANGIGGSNHVTATVSNGAAANGVARVEVELLDGSAKDVKVLGEQGSVAVAGFSLVAHYRQEDCDWGCAHLYPLAWSSSLPSQQC